MAAYGVIMYVSFIFISIFLGYSMGSAPIVSYHYGSAIIAITGVELVVVSVLLAKPLVAIFASRDAALFAMTT